MLNGVEFPIIGNLTRDPELQFSAAGKPWVRFSVAVNRVTNRDGNRNEATTFMNCKAFGDMAENIAASLKSGTRIMAYGRLEEEKWTDKDGQERRSFSFIIDEIGPSLRWAQTPTVEKTSRGGGSGGGYQGGGGSRGGYQGGGRPAPAEPQGDFGGGPSEPAGGGEDNPFF